MDALGKCFGPLYDMYQGAVQGYYGEPITTGEKGELDSKSTQRDGVQRMAAAAIRLALVGVGFFAICKLGAPAACVAGAGLILSSPAAIAGGAIGLATMSAKYLLMAGCFKSTLYALAALGGIGASALAMRSYENCCRFGALEIGQFCCGVREPIEEAAKYIAEIVIPDHSSSTDSPTSSTSSQGSSGEKHD